MKTLAQIELFEPADIKSTQYLLAIKFDTSRLCLSRFYTSRSASICYALLLGLSISLSAWAAYCYDEFPTQLWFLVALSSMYLVFSVDIALRSVAKGGCGLMGLLDVGFVAVVSGGVGLSLLFSSFVIVSTSAVLVSGFYPSKQLLLLCVESKCRPNSSELQMNESYSVEATPRDEYLDEVPEDIKNSEAAIL